MPAIQRLSQSIVNKIAAGEVIERPASVVKELLENAVDSGAARIDVAVEQGGGELVRVVDDGCGIPEDELPLAVAPHATSKIRSADDLFKVETLGFRGEALASIAEVSRLAIRSRTHDAPAGAELIIEGGVPGGVQPCGCACGTAIEVRQLFYNTPVRRKFLRAVQTEMGHTAEAFTRIALAWPSLHLTLAHNGRPVHDLPPVTNWPDRIASLFGRELADPLIEVDSRHGDVQLSGWVGNPSQCRANPRLQYLFLNGRAIRDRALQHALSEAYRGLILGGRYPIAFLRIEIPPEAVDVNVHPTKLEVRIAEAGNLYGHLLGALRRRFLAVDLTARLDPAQAASGAYPAALPSDHADQARHDLAAWARQRLAESAFDPAAVDGGVSARGDVGYLSREDSAHGEPFGGPHAPLELVPLDRSWSPIGGDDDEAPTGNVGDEFPGFMTGSAASTGNPTFETIAAPTAAMQVHNRYLVAESEDGIVVIDQHALHERILYEQLRDKVLAGSLETQRLLVPEPVDLAPQEAAAAVTHCELLGRIGLEVEPFGGDTLLVTTCPAILAGSPPGELLRELLDVLLAGVRPPDARDLVDELLHMFACKAAIKAGDRLSHEEVAALVAQRHLAQDSHHCPHGRPTALVFTRHDLDKQFKRI